MSLRKPEMILIDVDGTLVDSVPDLAFCVDEMQKSLNLPERGEASVRQWVGNGIVLIENTKENDAYRRREEELSKGVYAEEEV